MFFGNRKNYQILNANNILTNPTSSEHELEKIKLSDELKSRLSKLGMHFTKEEDAFLTVKELNKRRKAMINNDANNLGIVKPIYRETLQKVTEQVSERKTRHNLMSATSSNLIMQAHEAGINTSGISANTMTNATASILTQAIINANKKQSLENLTKEHKRMPIEKW